MIGNVSQNLGEHDAIPMREIVNAEITPSAKAVP